MLGGHRLETIKRRHKRRWSEGERWSASADISDLSVVDKSLEAA